jgi:MFS family permease
MTINNERRPQIEQAAQPEVPLRRNWAFQSLWIGAGSAFLGMDAADIAYPLIILSITGSPGMAGLFGLIQTAVMLAMGLPAGLVADRVNLKRLLVAAELTRAVAAGSVALALALHALTWPHLLIVSAVLGAAGTFAGPSRMMLVRAVVPRSQLTQALTQEEIRGGVTGLIGQPIGGILYTARQALPFLMCFLTFVVSAGCALFVRVPDGPRTRRPDADQGWSSIFAGIRELLANAALRAALMLVAMGNLISVALTLIIVVSLQQQGYSGSSIGLAMAGGAVGVIVGSILVRHIHRLLSPGWLLVVSGSFAVMCTLALALSWGPAWVFAVLLVFSLTGP